MYFDASQPNQLDFSGTAPSVGATQLSLFAQNPLNKTAHVDFEVLAQNNNGTSVSSSNVTSAQIAGSVIGSLIGLAALAGGGFSFWRYTTDKNSRIGEQFADCIREALKLKRIDNFKDHENGRKYVAFVHNLNQVLQQAGIDSTTMRPGEIRELANDVAAAARNKISTAIDCLGYSDITVGDLNNKIREIVTEVQVLRRGMQHAL